MIPKKGNKLIKGRPISSKMIQRKITHEEFFKFNDEGANIKTFILSLREIIPDYSWDRDDYDPDIRAVWTKKEEIHYYYRNLDDITFVVDILEEDVIKIGRKIANEYAKEHKIQVAFEILSTLVDSNGNNLVIKSSLITKNYKCK